VVDTDEVESGKVEDALTGAGDIEDRLSGTEGMISLADVTLATDNSVEDSVKGEGEAVDTLVP